MMSVSQERLYTVEEFERFIAQPENRDRLFELIQGEIVEKMPTEEHGELAANLVVALHSFVVPRKLGRVGVEIRHRMPNDTRNSLLPDVSFIAGKRPSVTEGSVPQMPDLAVEIKSPDDSLKDLRDKANYYLLNGTRLVWIVDPVKRLVITLTPDDEQILLENEVLDGGDVLPGFTMPVKDIFADALV
jgi:Uma2 family endonuclease